MMEVLLVFEISLLSKNHVAQEPEDSILHSHCRENPKSYITLAGWAV
jgi:hypothetical protein